MKEKIKNQKRFIQTPLFMTIIVSILVIGGISYFGVKQYQSYQIEKARRNKEMQTIMENQQKTLEQAQVEIEKLKQENESTKVKQQQLEKKIFNEQQKPETQNISISASEITPYLRGVVYVDCNEVSGSGSLWNIEGEYYLLTNQHIISKSYYRAPNGNFCILPIFNKNGGPPHNYYIFLSEAKKWNQYTDITLIPLHNDPEDNNSDKTKLNYDISLMQKCQPNMKTGEPVIVIGYPAYGQVGSITQISSNGIISGFGPTSPSLPYPNYFVSAKIDSGSSGGIAFSKDELGQLCILGVPTWLSLGNFETQGVVQNIWNIMYVYEP